MQLFKHAFIRIYFFYRDVLGVKRNTHHYASIIMALLIFANVYVLINGFTLLALRRTVFDYHTPFFILIGNALVLLVIIVASVKQRYKVLTEEFQTLSITEKERLKKISNVYVGISLALLFVVLFVRLY